MKSPKNEDKESFTLELNPLERHPILYWPDEPSLNAEHAYIKMQIREFLEDEDLSQRKNGKPKKTNGSTI